MHLISIPAADVFQALSDPIRIRMMRLFAVSGEETCLCELADSLLEPEYKLSRHLKILRQSGLLTASKDGRWIYHKLVKGVPFLSRLYATIRTLPDTEQEFAKDMVRFQKRIPLRESGRCRTGPVSNERQQKQVGG